MTIDDARHRRVLDRLHGLARFGMRPGLEATARALDAVGNPERRFSSLHIAGTNGKGSTAAFAESVLRAAGARTGLYTSPHLLRYTERFRVAGEEVAAADAVGWVERVLDGPGGGALTFFEVLTVAGFLGFAEQGVEIAVIECGLGGRLDATATCHPFATVITRIGIDHAEVLGDTVEEIAFEKVGIARRDVPLIVGPLDPGPRAVIAAHAASVGAPLWQFGVDFSAESRSGARIEYRGLGVDLADARLGLAGAHQAENAAVALAAVSFAPAAYRPDAEALGRGLASVAWPARFEQVAPDVIVDGAHNPDAAAALARALADSGSARGKPTLLIGVLGDKDVDGFLRALVPAAGRVVCTQPSSSRALSASELARRVRALFPQLPEGAVACDEDPAAALERARDGALVVVCGSLFLAGAVRGLLLDEKADPITVHDPVAQRAR